MLEKKLKDLNKLRSLAELEIKSIEDTIERIRVLSEIMQKKKKRRESQEGK